MQFTINAAALAAVLPLISTEEVRHTLTGILCRADGVLVATNGHILGMRRAGHTATADIIIRPNADLKRIVKHATGKRAPSPELTACAKMFDGQPESVTVSYFGLSVECEVAAGPFPNVAQVFPRVSDADPKPVDGGIAINPKLLALFGEHAHLVFYSPSRAILVRTNDDNFIGLLMPKRIVDKLPQLGCPEWVAEDKYPKLAAAMDASTIPAAA